MKDSFFSARNQFDETVASTRLPPHICEQMVEAGLRRIAEVKGTIYAAHLTQRLADICAGANVMPIDYWRQQPKSAPVEKPAKHGFGWRVYILVRDNPAIVFWLGFFIGCWYGGRS